MVKLENGVLMFPKNGKLPEVPKGYKATKDPYVMRPIIPKCTKRMIIMVRDPKCKCDKPLTFCDKKRITPYPDCFNCKEYIREEIEEKINQIEECAADGVITPIEEELIDELVEEIDDLFKDL